MSAVWEKLKTKEGRLWLKQDMGNRLWPLLMRIAIRYRRYILRYPTITTVIGSLGKSTATDTLITALNLDNRLDEGRNAHSALAAALFRTPLWQRDLALEVGIAYPGQMEGYGRMLAPDIVVVTCIANDHIDTMGSKEKIADEKAHMLRALKPEGLAVLNGDDDYVMWMATQTEARQITYGFGAHVDVRASHLEIDRAHWMHFDVHVQGQNRRVSTQLLGRHNVYPHLAAIAVGLERGHSLDKIIERFRQIEPMHGRMVPHTLESGATLLADDFKNPEGSTFAALDLIEALPYKRKIVVFGHVDYMPDEAAERDIGWRVGQRLAEVATDVVLFGVPNDQYVEGAVAAGFDHTRIVDVGEKASAAYAAIPKDLGPDDLILVKAGGRQRPARISLRLRGIDVACDVPLCAIPTYIPCRDCPVLNRCDAESMERVRFKKT